MIGISMVTWFLFHLTIWVVLLVVLIPFGFILWEMVKDLLTNDGKKMQEMTSILQTKAKNILKVHQNEDEKLPIKFKEESSEKLKWKPKKVKQEFSLDVPAIKLEKETVESEIASPPGEVTEIVSKSIKEEYEEPEEIKEVLEESEGIIYLDRQTSLTIELPEEEEQKKELFEKVE